MQTSSLILGIVIGVVIATPFAWFIGRQRSVLLSGKVQSLEERNSALEKASLASSTIDQMLKPVQEALSELKNKSEDADRRRSMAESMLKTEMELVRERNESLEVATIQGALNAKVVKIMATCFNINEPVGLSVNCPKIKETMK